MCSTEKLSPKITIDTITESGPALYKRIADLVKIHHKKLVLCVEKVDDINPTINKLVKHGIPKNRIVKYNPEDTSKKSQAQWKIVDQLMTDPNLRDIVVTWESGNRSRNYFPQCYPIAMFHFQLLKERDQLMGRSIRVLKLLMELKEFRGAVVDNNETRNRRDKRVEEEEDKMKKRQAEAVNKTVEAMSN